MKAIFARGDYANTDDIFVWKYVPPILIYTMNYTMCIVATNISL